MVTEAHSRVLPGMFFVNSAPHAGNQPRHISPSFRLDGGDSVFVLSNSGPCFFSISGHADRCWAGGAPHRRRLPRGPRPGQEAIHGRNVASSGRARLGPARVQSLRRLTPNPRFYPAAAARLSHSRSDHFVSSSSEDDDPALADELFPVAGAPTLLSVARSLANSPSPSASSVLGFLRRLPADASPHLFPHLVAALSRSPRPLLALRLFLRPPTSAATTHHSFNSALLRFPLPQHLLPAFFSHSLRRFPRLAPTLLSFNLLLKCVCSSLVPTNRHLYLELALRVLHQSIPAWKLVPDKFTYSTVVSALADAGRVDDAVALVHEMVVDGVVAAEAFNPVLGAMLRAGDVKGAAKLFSFMQLKGCAPSAATYNVLLHGLLLCGRARAAMGVMRRMEREEVVPGVMTYGAVVDGLVRCGRLEDAWKVTGEMGRKGLVPNEFVFSPVITGFCKLGEVDRASRVWDTMVAGGVKPNVVLYSAMIDGLARCGKMTEAELLFREMIEAKCVPNIMTYSSMVRGYFQIGDSSQALSFWEDMLRTGCIPNAVTYSVLITGLCNVGRSKDAMMVWKHMLGRGCVPDTIAYTSMIKGFCVSGMVDAGLRLFHDMLARGDTHPDVICYNVLLDGLLRAKDLPRAMDLLNQMLEQACDPDTVTCNTFLREIEVGQKGQEFLEGLVVRLCNRKRNKAAGEVLMVMLDKYIVPDTAILGMAVRGVCQRKRVWRVIDKCWDEIWRF